MGRYAGKITHSFSIDSNRPTFSQTLKHARIISVNAILEKLTPQEQAEFIRIAKEEELLI